LWKNPFDAIILDIKLSNVDGMELLKNIREAYPVTGTLMLLGAATLENALESLNQGSNAFILKPVELAELLCRLGTVTGFKRLERELGKALVRYNEPFTIINEEYSWAQLSDHQWNFSGLDDGSAEPDA
jgi:DNA-binding response OmpR family regulator